MKISLTIIMLMMSIFLMAQAVAINNSEGTDIVSNTSTLTISSFNVAANNNRLLIACATTSSNNSAPTVSFNGTDMTQITTGQRGGLRTAMYYMTLGSDVAATTANVVATGSSITNLGVISFHNVNQTTPFDGQVTTTGFATGMDVIPSFSSVTIASSSNDVVCDCLSINANGLSSITNDASQTQQVLSNKTNSPVIYMGMSTKAGVSPNLNMRWNFNTNTSLTTGQFIHIGANIRSATVLPVELTYFNGKSSGKGIQLFWQTASERDNAGFYVQRSSEGAKWENLTFESGKGTTLAANNYEWIDNNPLNGYNYYRLRQVDYDGSYKFSPVISIISGKKGKTLVYPNPTNGDLFYEADDLKSIKRIRLFDATGKLLYETTNINGKFSITHFPSGLYWFLMETSHGNIYERIVKQ